MTEEASKRLLDMQRELYAKRVEEREERERRNAAQRAERDCFPYRPIRRVEEG